jgi:hypothetical protein
MTLSPTISPPISTPTNSVPQQQDLSPDIIKLLKDSPEGKKLAAWIKGEYQKCKSSRIKQERQWYLNMAFYAGNQWVAYLKSGQNSIAGGKLTTPKAPPYRVRLTVNRVRGIVRTELSRFTSNKPNASVTPATSEDQDLFAASAGEQVWESMYVEKKLATVYARAAFWQSVCGVGFIKCWWDSNAVDKSTGQKGDICYSHVTPFHLFVPELDREEIEEQPYIINAYTKSVLWVKQTYGEDIKPSIVSSSEIMNEAFLDLSGAKTSKPDSCLVIEMWLKPGAHKDFPNGGVVTIVDNTIVGLYAGPMYSHGEYPFTKFEHVPTGKFYTESVITDIIPIQREYNRTRGQIIEAKNRMAKPQLMAPRGSIDPAKITSEPGIVILYRPGLAPPTPLQLMPLPNYVLQELDRSINDMEDISSQHQVSKGNAPSGVTAATAISFLQERDDSVLATTYASIESGWEKLAKQTLSHIVQFWDIARIVKVTGVDGSFDAISLKGSDIASGTDIRMEAGSALPTSKAARQALLMDLMKFGYIPPEKGLEMMEIGGTQRLFEEIAIDKRQAQRENLRMRSLDIQEIERHLQEVNSAKDFADYAAKFQGQQSPRMDSLGYPVQESQPTQLPPTDPNQLPPQQVQQQDNPGAAPLPPMLQVPPTNILPVNTWDNHATHMDVHNRFRKSQQFEQLDDRVKQQFESHVEAHAQALMQSAVNAQAAIGGPMDPNAGGPPSGPSGSNQFGPPNSSGGAPPPDPNAAPPTDPNAGASQQDSNSPQPQIG